MSELPLGWRTDLEVLQRSGAVLERHSDHIVVRSPDNPGFHWGNFVMVTSPELAVDAQACIDLFRTRFPRAGHVAIGLPEPVAEAWKRSDLHYEWDTVLVASSPPVLPQSPAGYSVRRLTTEDDWARCLAADVAEHVRTGGSAGADYTDFVRGRMRTRAHLTRQETGAFFGAFAGDELVADLGIVLCDAHTARYQSVATAYAHRGRGLASHLLSVAGWWAQGSGATRWVIVAEPASPAERLYRGLGMVPTAVSSQVYWPGAM